MPKNVKKEVFQAIKKGVFTPFLGAGASSLRPSKLNFNAYPWEQVAQTLAAVRRELHSDRSFKYLRSFARQRLRMSEGDLELYLPVEGKPHLAKALEGNLLVSVQAELVRATVRLTHYVGTHLADETPAFHGLEDYRVPFLASRLEDGEDAVRALIRAADIALTAREECVGDCESPFRLDDHRGLRIDRVYEKLLKIIAMLTTSETELFAEELQRHSEGLEDATTDEGGQLRLDVVQWMSDLLWYTLRYWLPCYPTTAELAFELALNVIDAPVRRAELAQAAQALETENLADLSSRIKDLMDYCEEREPEHGEAYKTAGLFYESIAAVLRHQFERHKAPIPEGVAKWGAEPQLDPPPLPIAFTTNFDRALERALERSGVPFHVLFPVIRAGGNRGEAGILPVTWKLRSWLSEEEAKVTGTFFEDAYWKDIVPDDGINPNIDWQGPLIVKLHGSPSEQRGMSDDHHWVVLSEVGYLQALAGSAMPKWIRSQLHDSVEAGSEGGRSLWFLGYSIADWNVRLRLYQDCQVGGARRTFNRDTDPYRMALLTRLGIETFVGDLNEFPRYIKRALKDTEIDTSPLVDNLVINLASE